MEAKETCRTLRELTGQESGIVIYGDGTIIACDWSNIVGLPRLFFPGVVAGFNEEIPVVEGEHCNVLAETFFGEDIDDIDIRKIGNDECPKSGMVYRINEDTIVIAPDDWC